jgi:hypothetical protein
MRWEKVADKLFRNTDSGLWLWLADGGPMVLPVPGASVTDIQALVQSITNVMREPMQHEPEKKRAVQR